MRIKIKVTLKDGEVIFLVHPAIYDIFKWHWEHKKDFKIGNRVMKHEEILAYDEVIVASNWVNEKFVGVLEKRLELLEAELNLLGYTFEDEPKEWKYHVNVLKGEDDE